MRVLKKKSVTKLLGLMLCLMMVFSVLPAAKVSAATIEHGEQVLYAHSKDGKIKGYVGIDVGDSVSAKDFKSTKSSVASVTGYNSEVATDYYYHADTKKFESITNKNLNVAVVVKKAGKATVSFKAGKDTHKFKVTVLEYTNPLKSFKVTGLADGKDIASKFKKGDTKTFKALKKSVKNGKVTIKAAKGWKITYVAYNEYKADKDDITDQIGKFRIYRSVSSVTLNMGKMTKNRDGYLSVTLVNDETGLPIQINANFER